MKKIATPSEVRELRMIKEQQLEIKKLKLQTEVTMKLALAPHQSPVLIRSKRPLTEPLGFNLKTESRARNSQDDTEEKKDQKNSLSSFSTSHTARWVPKITKPQPFSFSTLAKSQLPAASQQTASPYIPLAEAAKNLLEKTPKRFRSNPNSDAPFSLASQKEPSATKSTKDIFAPKSSLPSNTCASSSTTTGQTETTKRGNSIKRKNFDREAIQEEEEEENQESIEKGYPRNSKSRRLHKGQQFPNGPTIPISPMLHTKLLANSRPQKSVIAPAAESSQLFKARPMPNNSPFRLQPTSKDLTRPEPFNLQSEIRGEKHQKDLQEKLEQEKREKEAASAFKARPITIFSPHVRVII